MKAWQKLDKYYLLFFIVTLFLAALTIFTFREIFTVFVSAYETEGLRESQLKIDNVKLDAAFQNITEKEIIPLDVDSGNIIIDEESEAESIEQ